VVGVKKKSGRKKWEWNCETAPIAGVVPVEVKKILVQEASKRCLTLSRYLAVLLRQSRPDLPWPETEGGPAAGEKELLVITKD